MNYLAGGKMGDFIHSLIVCKYKFDESGEMSNIFLSNSGHEFEYDLDFTFNELKPLMEKQPWVNSFKLHENESIDIDLTHWRRSPLLYQTNWLEIYSNMYLNNVKIPNEYKWISVDRDDQYSNSLMINRSLKTVDDNRLYVYDEIIDKYDDVYFICFDVKQYYQFPLHYKTKLLLVDNLYDFFTKIGSCHFFMGNQSGPFAWASSMNIPRAVELLDIMDRTHYINDSNYYEFFSYF
jgi:glycerophosphoryl diester phosphodiesterase